MRSTPRAGSKVNHQALTASVIDSREFLAARRRAESEVMLADGVRIAFAGGLDCNDHRTIWNTLDRVRAKHPDMVLLHGGNRQLVDQDQTWVDRRDPVRQRMSLP